MNDSVPVVAKPPARDHAPPDRGQEPAPSDAFAAALGAAQPAEAPPPAEPAARTAHAEGTKAEGDSSGPHTRKTARAPQEGAIPAPSGASVLAPSGPAPAAAPAAAALPVAAPVAAPVGAPVAASAAAPLAVAARWQSSNSGCAL